MLYFAFSYQYDFHLVSVSDLLLVHLYSNKNFFIIPLHPLTPFSQDFCNKNCCFFLYFPVVCLLLEVKSAPFKQKITNKQATNHNYKKIKCISYLYLIPFPTPVPVTKVSFFVTSGCEEKCSIEMAFAWNMWLLSFEKSRTLKVYQTNRAVAWLQQVHCYPHRFYSCCFTLWYKILNSRQSKITKRTI